MPRLLQRDRDGIYGKEFRRQLEAFNIEELVSAPRSPLQDGHVERVIGSIRRECLDHDIVLGEHHIREILKQYVTYDKEIRTQLGLEGDAPAHRMVEGPEQGEVSALAALHHVYRRRAA